MARSVGQIRTPPLNRVLMARPAAVAAMKTAIPMTR